ncbi:MAG: endonuclease III [Candidatus Aenigmarchaeota archaeon]|nr:endonuclease III [Candidatus Aenigmarchaeota archaeon]
MEIPRVISTLKKETPKFKETIITKVSRRQSPFQVLVSCILSLRTKDQVTSKASERLFSLATTPEKILSLTERQIQKAIYPVAFYRIKSRNLKKMSKILLENFNGEVPSKMESLLELPNVGRKTANIVLVHGFQKHAIPVDTHVHRIPNRLGWVKTKTPEQTEFALRKILPKKYWQDFNDLIVTWGQNVCVPISPWCSKCAIKKYCKRVGVGRSR